MSSSNKRYYWLKLKEDFFEDDTIQWLEEQENGKEYVIFYLKLALKSLDGDGKLIRYVGERLLPYDVKALAKLTNTSPDTVAVAMKTFIDIGLVSRLEGGEIYMNQIQEMVGSETKAAESMRRLRATEKAQKQLENNSGNNVTESYPELLEIEIDKELEIEKELEKDILSGKAEPHIPFQEIVEYLNEKAETKYRHTGKKTQTLIKARYSEGFNLDDFKKVIDIKVNEWLNDKSMNKYLRPETLFGTKFESYLNQKTKGKGGGYDTSEYDDFF
jgi:uncharacterized phage protein (TIGR02220 family)/predicted phage replisome organizer